MKTRVRVRREELLKIVEGRLRKAERVHERAVKAYPAELAAHNKRVVAQLEKALQRARAGQPVTRNGSGYLHFDSPPMKPSSNGRELCNLRRLHKTLQIGAEDSILLSQEDADAYFGPCQS